MDRVGQLTPEFPGPLQIAAGYMAAVAVAATTTAAILAIAARDSSLFLLVAVVGSLWISVFALPGFLLTVAIARQRQWTGWGWFAMTGGLTAALAWVLLGGADTELFRASIRGGVAGGVSYWWMAYHGLSRPGMARWSELR